MSRSLCTHNPTMHTRNALTEARICAACARIDLTPKYILESVDYLKRKDVGTRYSQRVSRCRAGGQALVYNGLGTRRCQADKNGWLEPANLLVVVPSFCARASSFRLAAEGMHIWYLWSWQAHTLRCVESWYNMRCLVGCVESWYDVRCLVGCVTFIACPCSTCGLRDMVSAAPASIPTTPFQTTFSSTTAV
eukprot:355453-Chlamydomonas_euryale.AAC.2